MGFDIHGEEQYNELDFITQAEAPMDFESNGILSQLANEYILDFEQVKKYLDTSYGMCIEREHLIKDLIGKLDNNKAPDLYLISNCFKWSVEGEEDGWLDFETKEIVGLTVKLVKIKTHYTDEEALEHIARSCYNIVYSINGYAFKDNLNEVLELFGNTEARKSRSVKNKIRNVQMSWENIVRQNKWNIRNDQLLKRVSEWIVEFVNSSNTAAFANLCRIKIMTHSGHPIYKMEETI